MQAYTEATLVQQTTADHLKQQLGWASIRAYNAEDFGPNNLLGRASDNEVVLTRILCEKLVELNPSLPDVAYDDVVRQMTATVTSQSRIAANREKYDLMRDGVQVSFQNDKGERTRERLRVFDFDAPENNHFLCVRELWVQGDFYCRRAQSALGVGHHLSENRRRLAVFGRGGRVVFTGGGGLGDGEGHDAVTDGQGLEDGAVAARQLPRQCG